MEVMAEYCIDNYRGLPAQKAFREELLASLRSSYTNVPTFIGKRVVSLRQLTAEECGAAFNVEIVDAGSMRPSDRAAFSQSRRAAAMLSEQPHAAQPIREALAATRCLSRASLGHACYCRQRLLPEPLASTSRLASCLRYRCSTPR